MNSYFPCKWLSPQSHPPSPLLSCITTYHTKMEIVLSLTHNNTFHRLLFQPSIPSRPRRTLPLLPQPSSSLSSSLSPLPTLPSSKTIFFCANSNWDRFHTESEEDEIEDKEHGKGCFETAAAASSYEEDLIREVEQLLTPEERAILDMNKTPDLNKISTPKWNLLHTFALAIQIPLMDKLLESGIDINSVDKDGVTPLHKAVMGKKEAVISHLLRKRANPHVRDRDGATPLHYAVQVGALQTVKLLIKYKVDVNVADNEGWTPLHLAIQGRNRDIAKVLLVSGADSTRRNKDGKTALDLSLCYGRDFKSYDLARLLKLVPANRDP